MPCECKRCDCPSLEQVEYSALREIVQDLLRAAGDSHLTEEARLWLYVKEIWPESYEARVRLAASLKLS